MKNKQHDERKVCYEPDCKRCVPPQTAPQNMLEVIKYEHKGIEIYVKIDYLKGHISLVDHTRAWQGKEWKFTERSIEYMQGWKNILEAMKMAVEFAEAKLRMRQDKAEEELNNLMIDILSSDKKA